MPIVMAAFIQMTKLPKVPYALLPSLLAEPVSVCLFVCLLRACAASHHMSLEHRV